MYSSTRKKYVAWAVLLFLCAPVRYGTMHSNNDILVPGTVRRSSTRCERTAGAHRVKDSMCLGTESYQPISYEVRSTRYYILRSKYHGV